MKETEKEQIQRQDSKDIIPDSVHADGDEAYDDYDYDDKGVASDCDGDYGVP